MKTGKEEFSSLPVCFGYSFSADFSLNAKNL